MGTNEWEIESTADSLEKEEEKREQFYIINEPSCREFSLYGSCSLERFDLCLYDAVSLRFRSQREVDSCHDLDVYEICTLRGSRSF